MKSLALILSTFIWASFTNGAIHAQQISTVISFASIPSGPSPHIGTIVKESDYITPVTSGSVTVELCSYTLGGQPPSYCFSSCTANVNNGGRSSCLLDLPISPGEYTLFAFYSEGGGSTYQNSEVRQNVAGDFGGGISPI